MNEPDSQQPLSAPTADRVGATRLGISLDWWAVIAGVLLAGLVYLNWLPLIKW